MMRRDVFVTGVSGYLGRALAPRLAARGHRVRGLVRAASLARLPTGCEAVVGEALDLATWEHAVTARDTLVHLVGVPHPAPWKGDLFDAVDLPAALASIAVARDRGLTHLVYLSVAQPASVMRRYVAVRARAEGAIAAAGTTATCVRPWYVLGPGHRWAHLLRPLYALAERLPSMRERALRLGLTTLDETVAALVWAVENPPAAGTVRIVDVPAIRAIGRGEAAVAAAAAA